MTEAMRDWSKLESRESKIEFFEKAIHYLSDEWDATMPEKFSSEDILKGVNILGSNKLIQFFCVAVHKTENAEAEVREKEIEIKRKNAKNLFCFKYQRFFLIFCVFQSKSLSFVKILILFLGLLPLPPTSPIPSSWGKINITAT